MDPLVRDRDVRGGPPRDRQLALGGRAVLPAHRQAAAEARDRDRHPVPGGAARASSGSSRSDPEPDLLALRIQPDEGILLRFGAKVPGLDVDIRTVNMDFGYGTSFSVDSPDAYETLMLDALLGDQSLFTRADEVEEAWRIVTPIVETWIGGPPPDVPGLRGRHVGPQGGGRAPRARRPPLAPDLRRAGGRPDRPSST